MRPNIKILKTLLKLIFICSLKVSAQNSVTADSIIGEWFYHAPKNMNIGDTIILSKDDNKAESFVQWIFNSKDEFIVYGVNKKQKEGEFDIGYKSVGDKWYFDSESNTLIIDKGHHINHYNLILYKGNEIILLKVK